MSAIVDVAVVGAGIVGAATAYELSQKGMTVVIFEKGAVNRAGSGATAGNLHIQAVHKKRPGQKVALDQVRFLPLQIAASKLWDTVEDDLETDVEMRRIGGITVAETAEDAIEIQSKRKEEEKLGIPGEILTLGQLREFEPLLGNSIVLAEYCPLDGYVNPLKITPAWLRAAVRNGVEVFPFTEVIAISPVSECWKLTTKSGNWLAKNVVLAPGPWTTNLLAQIGLDIKMNSVAIQMHLTERTKPQMRYLIQHIGQGLSVKQVNAGQILIGGGWPAKHLDLEASSPISLDSVVGNMTLATRVLPFLGELRLLRAWTGALGATADEMPIIGPISGYTGIFLAGGTYSFTFAPLWAKVLTQLITEQPLEVDIEGLKPDRLINKLSGIRGSGG